MIGSHDSKHALRLHSADVSTDDAWKTLSLIVEWVRHAEAKAAAVLASAGVAGGVLYAMVGQVKVPSVPFIVGVSFTGVAITVAGLCAGVALLPRLFAGRLEPNLVYFRSIAERFPTDPDNYCQEFAQLASDRAAMLSSISAQIWSNSRVASRKYRVTGVSIATLLLGSAGLAVTAALKQFGL